MDWFRCLKKRQTFGTASSFAKSISVFNGSDAKKTNKPIYQLSYFSAQLSYEWPKNIFHRTAKTIVEDEAEARGDVIIFCPKFHPELSPIESAYREVAKVLREENVVGSSRGVK